jgi:signal transduction histidine kinase/CheY-like chemotaxis protein
MAIATAFSASRVGEDLARVRALYLVAGLLYPAWHLLAPAGSRDPWLTWWIVSSLWVTGVLGSRLSRRLDRNLRDVLPLSTWLVSGHLFVLAARNDMHPFYAIGSAMAVVAAIVTVPSQTGLLAYSAYVVTLGGGLFASSRNPLMLAYWGGLAPLLALAYYRRTAHQAAKRLADEYRDRLESQVADRTRALSEANEQLREEMERRERLETELRVSHQMEAVGRLAAAVSHEFNNLLCTIGIYSELILEQLPAESELRREIGQIQHAHRQATALSRQLLALSRPNHIRFESVDLGAVVERMRPALQRMLGSTATLDLRLAPEPCLVWANPDVIEQILINLALNARDAIPLGGTVTIATSSGTADVSLEVSDTGIGMDRETRERAFDPFFTTKTTGTGLGLSIVHSLVSQSDGRIQIDSEQGCGTRFQLSWPRALAEQRVQNSRAERSAPEAGSETILLVEDQKELRAGLRRILAAAGYRVLEAPDGQQALEIANARGDDIQLVVSDVVMPAMDGFELAERFSAGHPGVPILFVSGQLRHPSIQGEGLPAGASVLRKPFSPHDLRSRVREILDAHPTHSPNAR